ncbi:hypothetical protein GW17_00022974 [Ensete ventricosum]|nr:hypothetical protein GW17_00022974 [Ensete ventricosum]
MRALRSRSVGALPPWLPPQCQHNPLAERSRTSSLVNFFGMGTQMAVEGAVGLGIAGRGATLVLRTSWFNRSSWICAKEIVAIRVFLDVDAEDDSRLMDLRLGGRRWKRRQKQLWELLGKVEAVEMATGQQERGSDTR